MIRIDIDSIHLFRKTNIVTLIDEEGQYDEMKCSECGIEGKCRNFTTVEVDGRAYMKARRCTMSKKQEEKEKVKEDYKWGKKTQRKCPKCKSSLRKIHSWTEEGKKGITHITVSCLCGYSDLIEL